MLIQAPLASLEDAVARTTPGMLLLVVADVLVAIPEELVTVLAVVVFGAFSEVSSQTCGGCEVKAAGATDMVVVGVGAAPNMVVPVIGVDVTEVAIYPGHGHCVVDKDLEYRDVRGLVR